MSKEEILRQIEEITDLRNENPEELLRRSEPLLENGQNKFSFTAEDPAANAATASSKKSA